MINQSPTIILGIDPGSRITGYGVIKVEKNKNTYITCGNINIKNASLAEKLRQIFAGLNEIILAHQPTEAAIEQVFMHNNPDSAIKLGQARGAAMVAVANQFISLAEYSARQIKQAVVGYGAASKEQVQHMVCQLLQLEKPPQADAADALACALCHAHSRRFGGEIAIRSRRKRRLRPSQLAGIKT